MPEPPELEAILDRLRLRVLDGPGQLDVSIRQAAFRDDLDTLPEDVAPYVAKVHRYAYEVTDQDVAALRESGMSEDQIFELTVAAAVGAGLSRLDKARAVRRGSEA